MGKVNIIESGSDVTITLDGNTADISAGGKGQDGKVIIRDKLEKPLAEIRAGQIVLLSPDGHQRFFLGSVGLVLGGNGARGDIRLVPPGASGLVIADKATISLDGDAATIALKNGDTPTVRLDGATARVSVSNDLGKETIRLDGTGSSLTGVGPKDNGGVFIVRNALNHEIFRVDYIWVDMPNKFEQHGMVHVKNSNGKDMVVLDGQHGDIKLEGADCAERFPIADEASRDPGTVLVAGDCESLVSCTEAYDRRVAGVVSGAGGHRPGIILDNNADRGAAPIALVGKVYCKVDAGYGSIKCGDPLTTSQTQGHAMRASDRERAFGSVLGKALAPLSEGKALIPILIALQ